jgi:hypothetical protein
MALTRVTAACVVLCAVLSAGASGEVLYDSGGFESFPLGSIAQNAGWRGIGSNDYGGTPGNVPAVVVLPDGNRALELRVPDANGAMSYFDFTANQIPELTTGRMTVEFDVLRVSDGWTSNLWWSMLRWGASGNCPLGVQWDAAGGTPSTWPLGWGSAGVNTVFGRFATISMTYDFDLRRCTASYDGRGVPAQPLTIDRLPNLLYVWLGHDEATGRGPETLWFDNLQITWVPEPTAALLLAAGLLLVRRR